MPRSRIASHNCGHISIAYPFDVEPSCYLDGFDVTCDHSYRPPKLFLGDGAAEITDIFISNGTVHISNGRINISDLVLSSSRGEHANTTTWGSGLHPAGPFFLSEQRNK
ncbi:hypothetical protein PR202_gb02760 [Eleusine coracana subsp. coracana]|uniref:Wall-associated receptor kinase galacturonan-binding domain-containing protein n=1 Tax=Eleusine coracana subsp. coracana TaxID=191504 RepID=A0AAV5DZB6_ELECO|nr:hypothetical protein PR202_gb02760 [Eleusine coracana subsp. coracana]